MHAKPLVVLGSVNADLYVEIDRLPLPGETIAGAGAAMRPGGKGANQAAAAARLGQPTWFAGQLGDDSYAQPLRTALTAAGVKVDLLGQAPGATGQAFILLQRGGENSIIVVGGANQDWPALSPAIAEHIRGAGALLLQREVPEAINLAAARTAHAAGVPVVLDAGGSAAPCAPALMRLVGVFSPNESELGLLTGLPTGSEGEVVAAARRMQREGVGTVLVKLGSRGALVVPADGEVLRQSAFKVPVVDTTGAGDCFTAAYTVALLEGMDQARRLHFAAAAAALCVQSKGAMPSMPDRRRVEALLRG